MMSAAAIPVSSEIWAFCSSTGTGAAQHEPPPVAVGLDLLLGQRQVDRAPVAGHARRAGAPISGSRAIGSGAAGVGGRLHARRSPAWRGCGPGPAPARRPRWPPSASRSMVHSTAGPV